MDEPLHREILQRLTTIEAHSKGTLEEAKKTNGRIGKLEGNQFRIILALTLSFGLIIGLGSTNFPAVLSILL